VENAARVASRVRVVLSLNVENLDLEDRRAPRGEAGCTWVNWRCGTARLLSELLAGRTRGQLFLADRRPAPARVPTAAPGPRMPPLQDPL
jgi:hypothetical protein